MLVAMLPAMLLLLKADPARFDAWLNLSHREKARVLVIVKTRAIAREEAQSAPRPPTVSPPYDGSPGNEGYAPTSGSQMNLKVNTATSARAIQKMGWA